MNKILVYIVMSVVLVCGGEASTFEIEGIKSISLNNLEFTKSLVAYAKIKPISKWSDKEIIKQHIERLNKIALWDFILLARFRQIKRKPTKNLENVMQLRDEYIAAKGSFEEFISGNKDLFKVYKTLDLLATLENCGSEFSVLKDYLNTITLKEYSETKGEGKSKVVSVVQSMLNPGCKPSVALCKSISLLVKTKCFRRLFDLVLNEKTDIISFVELL